MAHALGHDREFMSHVGMEFRNWLQGLSHSPAQPQIIEKQLEGKFELVTAFIFNFLTLLMSNPASLSRQEMLWSSGKCLHNFCIIFSRYLASSTGNDFSIWGCVTECPR